HFAFFSTHAGLMQGSCASASVKTGLHIIYLEPGRFFNSVSLGSTGLTSSSGPGGSIEKTVSKRHSRELYTVFCPLLTHCACVLLGICLHSSFYSMRHVSSLCYFANCITFVLNRYCRLLSSLCNNSR